MSTKKKAPRRGGKGSASLAVVPDGSDRTAYLGGSDAASCLGVSPWRSQYRLWCEKSGGEAPPDLSLLEWIEWGNRLEPFVADAFASKTGLKIEVEPRFLNHAKYPFLGGHIDRRILGPRRAFLECKTTNAYDYRMWGDEAQGPYGIPRHYLAQCDHYMMVDDSEFCWLAVLIGGSGFRKYYIERDAKREKELLAAELRVWDLIQQDVMPAIESEQDAKHRWKMSLEGTAIPVDAATRSKVITLSIVSERRKIADKEEKALRNDIFPIFRDAQALSFNGERIATLNSFYRSDFDQEAFMKKHPKIGAKFMRSLPTKRLKLLV